VCVERSTSIQRSFSPTVTYCKGSSTPGLMITVGAGVAVGGVVGVGCRVGVAWGVLAGVGVTVLRVMGWAASAVLTSATIFTPGRALSRVCSVSEARTGLSWPRRTKA